MSRVGGLRKRSFDEALGRGEFHSKTSAFYALKDLDGGNIFHFWVSYIDF